MAYKMKGFSGFKSSPVKKEKKYYRHSGLTKEEYYDKKYKEELDAKRRYEEKHTPKPKSKEKTTNITTLDKKSNTISKKKAEINKLLDTSNNGWSDKPKTHKKPLGEIYESSTPVKHGDTPLHKKSLVDKVQTGLAVGGMTPVFGAVPDLLNTGISGARAIKARLTGDKEGAKKHLKKAAISGISTIPGPGDAVGAKALSDDLGYKKKEHKWKQNIPEKGYRDIKKT